MAEWTLRPGETIVRSALHDEFGGGRYGGMEPSAQTPNIFIFMNPETGARFGYEDTWDGEVLHYTGEGQIGHQEMAAGNKALLNHFDDGRSVRLFEGSGGVVTYLGEYRLDEEDPYYETTAPDMSQQLRKVFKFRLRPAEPGARLPGGRIAVASEPLKTAYQEQEEHPESELKEPFDVDPDAVDRALGTHRKLQNLMAAWVKKEGYQPLSPGGPDPGFDMAWETPAAAYVVEVKSTTPHNEQGQLRLGIGQVLHYRWQLQKLRPDKTVQAILLVPNEPTWSEWQDLCGSLAIDLLWPRGGWIEY